MKIRIPLPHGLEAKIEIAKPNHSHWTTTEITPEEYDALMAALGAQRPNITGQSWSDVSDDEEITPDYAALVEIVKEGSGAVAINGVKIQRCDERGLTEADQALYRFRQGESVTIDGGIGSHKLTVETGGITVGKITVPPVEESEWSAGTMAVKPTPEQLNHLAQKFYTASGLSLSAFDKPHIVQGLAAIFEMEVE